MLVVSRNIVHQKTWENWETNRNLKKYSGGYVFEFMPNHKPYEELYCWQNNDTIEERSVYT